MRVVGGRLGRIENYPYQASIRRTPNSVHCGGAIISNRHILTAAHCLEKSVIVAGTAVYTGTNDAFSGERHEIKRYWTFPGWRDVSTIYYDIGIIEVIWWIDEKLESNLALHLWIFLFFSDFL